MGMDSIIVGGTSGNKQEVNSLNHAKTVTETNAIANPSNIGGVRNFSENDQGYITAATKLASPEVDVDYRLRASSDIILDEENFFYSAQNTGKHFTSATSTAATFSGGTLTINSGSIITAGTGYRLVTYGYFPIIGTQTLSADFELAFSAQPQTQVTCEFGVGLPGIETAAPSDGVFFRLNSSGLAGIASFGGAEVSTGIFPLAANAGTWAYTSSKRYQFIVYANAISAEFWVNDGTGAVKLGEIQLPAAQGRICQSMAVQAFLKHRIGGSNAGGVLQLLAGGYTVRLGGAPYATLLGEMGNRAYGSYQGLSGGTMGSLAAYANSTNPTAAAPSNTALTANLPSGLGGQGLVTAAAAAATDGIWGSYQVPAGTTTVQGRRLVVRGIIIAAVNTGAAVATTATTIQFSLAYGHTAVSLATAEAAAAKAPRRIPLGIMTWAVAAAIGQGPQNGPIKVPFASPIFVNPAEFIALVGKFLVGTATASQTINFTWALDYGWE